MSVVTQLFTRQPRAVEFVLGPPAYTGTSAFEAASAECRVAQYLRDGLRFAYTQPKFVSVVDPASGDEIKRLDVQDAFDLHWSPKGRYLCLWLKPVKDAELGNFSDNVQLYDVDADAIVARYLHRLQLGWKPQFTADELLVTRATANAIHFYTTGAGMNMNKPAHRLEAEGFSTYELLPGLNPAVAVFTPERLGMPASVRVYNVPSFAQPIALKLFFKAERCQLKWNVLGTALLALALTDVDLSNQLYYGETNLYLLGIAGLYDLRITLDKDGPIHDIHWLPLLREFGVVYGYMPAKTTIFDARGNTVLLLPEAPRNHILFSPHAKYVIVAGFGNLQGKMDVYDRQNKFAKVTTIDASNTSVCEWLPDGRHILTATTAPRLRVDNGLKVWHVSGLLMYVQDYKELLLVQWRPQEVTQFPPLPKLLEAAPTPQPLAVEYLAKKPQPAAGAAPKATGAYRPPHARRAGAVLAAPVLLYEREQSSGSSSSVNSTSGAAGGYKPPAARGPRVVPGAAPPAEPAELKSAAKNRKKREARQKAAAEAETGESATPEPAGQSLVPLSLGLATVQGVVGGVALLEDKKIRLLLKKLRAIETLKMKQAQGEPLEDTQVLKIKTEDTVRNELSALGWTE